MSVQISDEKRYHQIIFQQIEIFNWNFMIDCQLPQLDLCKLNIFLLWRQVNGLHSTKVPNFFWHEIIRTRLTKRFLSNSWKNNLSSGI